MLQICVLASGSKGNAIYVSDGITSVLIDAGLSGIELERRLKSRKINPDNLNAIIVSHEHADHVAGIGVLSRRFRLPVYLHRGVSAVFSRQVGPLQAMEEFESGRHFRVGTLSVRPLSVSHDAVEPVCFTVENHSGKIGIATDLGLATGLVRHHLQGCGLVVLEANHDPAMLEKGPYPWALKQRIRSRLGHLSNEASRDLLGEIMGPQLRHVVLAHLSETNNRPEKALSVAAEALSHSAVRLSAARQDAAGEVLSLSLEAPS